MNFKHLVTLLLFSTFSPLGLGQVGKQISFGPVVIGEDRLNLEFSDFQIFPELRDLKVEAHFDANSLQWIRKDEVLMLPRAELLLTFNTNAEDVTLKYQGRSIIPGNEDGQAKAQFFYSLFEPSPIEVFYQGKKEGMIHIRPKEKIAALREKHMIDYSCSKFDLHFEGLDDEFASFGCRLSSKGPIGEEKGVVDLHFHPVTYRLLDQSSPHYHITLNAKRPVTIQMITPQGEKKLVYIKANVPERIHRLSTAMGIGPYLFDTAEGTKSTRHQLTSPILLYANYKLTEDTSIRSFEAYFAGPSMFSNFGTYFAYNVGQALDNRLQVVTLLGMQLVSFHQHAHPDKHHRVIYPQAFEVTYAHAFGLKNHHLAYGMFIAPTSGDDYNNMWLRFGKGWFWELNYISWRQGDAFARGWGLSLGLPLAKFL